MQEEKVSIMILSDTFEDMGKLLNVMGNRDYNIKGYLYHAEYLMDIEEVEPQLIVIDLPDTTRAMKIVEEIKQKDAINKIPIVVGIECEEIGVLEKYRESGIKDYILKPYDACMVAITIDNTLAYVNVSAKLREKEIQFDALFNNAPYMTWFKDRDSNYMIANNEFQEHCGKGIDKIQGSGDCFVWDGQIGERCRTYDQEVMNQRKQVIFDEIIPGKKGYREFNIYKSPVIDEVNNVIGTVGVARDITDLKIKKLN